MQYMVYDHVAVPVGLPKLKHVHVKKDSQTRSQTATVLYFSKRTTSCTCPWFEKESIQEHGVCSLHLQFGLYL